MKDEDVIKIIEDYVKDDRYKQAVLIDGEWGSGKTFFVKEKLLESLKNNLPDKKIYYISLYGVSSAEQILDEIYSSMFGKIMEERLGEVNGKVAEKGILVTSKLFAAGMKYFNIEKQDLPKLSDVKELKSTVVIFDDLERCEIEINQTLGVINNLVEHNDIKIILVANQNEIGKMNFSKDISNKYQIVLNDKLNLEEGDKKEKDKAIVYTKEQLIKRTEQLFNEDALYKKVREKLIGLTIYYQPNMADVFVSVIDAYIKENKSKEYLLKNKQKIVNMFDEQKHYNIRTLIFSLIAFEKIFNIIDSIKFEEHRYIERELDSVLKYIVISSIRIKSGKAPYCWENSSVRSGIVHYDKKNIFNDQVYGYKFVDDYLLQCRLNEKEIVDTILKIVSEQKLYDESKELENSLAYGKLHPWWELEDNEIKEILYEILTELKDLKYEPRYFKDMIVTLMQMEYQNFKCFEYKDFVDLMAKKIQTYDGEFERRNLEVLSDDEEFVKKYVGIVQPLFEILDKKESKDKKEDNSFLCNKESWDKDFREKCQDNNQVYITDNKFFYYIDPDKFIIQLQNAKTAHIYNFMSGIKTVYCFSNLNEFFKNDIPNLRSILEKLDVKLICGDKKTKKIALNNLEEKLQEYLKLIERPIYRS